MEKLYEENVFNVTYPAILSYIRKRPQMYVGSLNIQGFIKMFKEFISEIFDHSDALSLDITLIDNTRMILEFKDCSLPVLDDFLININSPIKRTNYTVLYFLVALTERFNFTFFNKKGNSILYQNFSKGLFIEGVIENKKYHPNRIVFDFELDKTVWEVDTFWTENFFLEEIQNFAYFHKKRKFRLNYSIDNEPCHIVFQYPNGLLDKLYLEKLRGHGNIFFNTSIEVAFDGFSVNIAFAFREYDVDESFFKSFVNDSYTHEGGTHVDALLKGITYGAMKYFKKHELTNDYKISQKAVKTHLLALINIHIETPIFGGCVRNYLTNPEIITPLSDYIADEFYKKIELDSKSREQLIRRFRVNW
jgi:topoisomerase-4 subunit B